MLTRQSSSAYWQRKETLVVGTGGASLGIIREFSNLQAKGQTIPYSQILRKEFRVSQKVLLFNSCLELIVGKLHFRWDGPFVITNVFPYGVVELKDEATNSTFQVNRYQLKTFHEGPTPTVGEVESISLMEPAISDDTLEQSLIILSMFITCIESNASFKMDETERAHYKPKSRKTIINLNLRSQKSFGIVLGIGLA
ncbi:hypothetical protein CR513_41295, partial [Mucuna pruriens]